MIVWSTVVLFAGTWVWRPVSSNWPSFVVPVFVEAPPEPAANTKFAPDVVTTPPEITNVLAATFTAETVRLVVEIDVGVARVQPRHGMALLVGQQVLHGGSINPCQPLLQAFSLSPWQSPASHVQFLNRLDGLAGVSRRQADLHTLRGLLALESGAILAAERTFREALTAWNGDSAATAIARHYLRLIQNSARNP